VAKNPHIACLCGHGLQIRAIETDYETEHILAIWVSSFANFWFKISANGLQLQEGRDFYHKT
jgi:hypothetical protein